MINTAITLPIGVEAYSVMALGVWLGHLGDHQTQRFARVSALVALLIGMAGQVIYHVLIATGTSQAPIGVVIGVACLPVAILGSAGALVHMLNAPTNAPQTEPATQPSQAGESASSDVAANVTDPAPALSEPETGTSSPSTETPEAARPAPGIGNGIEATVMIPGPFVTDHRKVRDVIDVITPAS